MIEIILFEEGKLEVTIDAKSDKLIEDIINSERVTVTKKWKSKYNEYVVHDYEPFCIEGFNIIYELYDNDINKLKFIQMLLSNLNNNLLMLERIFKGEKLIKETIETD